MITEANQSRATYAASALGPKAPALCVDVDGTLIKSDTLLDAMLTLFRRKPAIALLSALSLLRGKAAFKAEIARHITLDPATLSYNRPLLNHLRAEHASGRDIYLATAANEKQARGIADHLGIIAGVFASGESVKLRQGAKLEELQRQFPEGFDYIGNATPDIPVLAQAKTGMLANPSPGLAARLKLQRIEIHKTRAERQTKALSFLFPPFPLNENVICRYRSLARVLATVTSA